MHGIKEAEITLQELFV